MPSESLLTSFTTYNPIARLIQPIFNLPFLQDLTSYFYSLLFRAITPKTHNFLFAAGVAGITYKIANLLWKQYQSWKWVPKHYSNRKNVNEKYFKSRYGQNVYAVVTGPTEGIGFAFALQFARMNIGVVLVARNNQKLEKRIQEIKYLVPNFKYEKVIGDLSKSEDIKSIAKSLAKLCETIDIGIVINNAGHAGSKFCNFIQQDIPTMKDVININYLAPYEINQALIPILRRRKNRSAIVNTSSCTGYYISHGNGLYTVTKLMLDIYSRTTSLENADKIDILSSRPFGVRTPMMNNLKGKLMITAHDCVLSTLADLEQHTSFTGFLHKAIASNFDRLSEVERLKIYDVMFSKFK